MKDEPHWQEFGEWLERLLKEKRMGKDDALRVIKSGGYDISMNMLTKVLKGIDMVPVAAITGERKAHRQKGTNKLAPASKVLPWPKALCLSEAETKEFNERAWVAQSNRFVATLIDELRAEIAALKKDRP